MGKSEIASNIVFCSSLCVIAYFLLVPNVYLTFRCCGDPVEPICPDGHEFQWGQCLTLCPEGYRRLDLSLCSRENNTEEYDEIARLYFYPNTDCAKYGDPKPVIFLSELTKEMIDYLNDNYVMSYYDRPRPQCPPGYEAYEGYTQCRKPCPWNAERVNSCECWKIVKMWELIAFKFSSFITNVFTDYL